MLDVIRRFFETISVVIIISMIIGLMYAKHYLPNNQLLLAFISIAAVILFCFINILMLRHCYMDYEGDIKYFYTINYIAYSIFVVITILSLFFSSQVLFTYVFGITKFLHTATNMPTIISVIIFHIIVMTTIFFVPRNMNVVLSADDTLDIDDTLESIRNEIDEE